MRFLYLSDTMYFFNRALVLLFVCFEMCCFCAPSLLIIGPYFFMWHYKEYHTFSSVWCLQLYRHEERTREVCDLSSTQPHTTSMGKFLFHVWVSYFVVEIQDFWIAMLCLLVNRYVYLAEAYCLCHQVLGVWLFLDCWALEMAAVPSSKISVAVCQLTSQKTLTSIKTAVRTSKHPLLCICNLYN